MPTALLLAPPIFRPSYGPQDSLPYVLGINFILVALFCLYQIENSYDQVSRLVSIPESTTVI